MSRLLPTLLIAVLAAALPHAASARAPSTDDGRIDYSLVGGATMRSGTTASASANIGSEAALATADSRWRFGGKALWSRLAGETTAESVTVLLTQESQHRWAGNTWFRQKVSVFPAMRSGEGVRGSFDTGLAVRVTRLVGLNVGMTHRYDGTAGARRGQTQFVTGVAMRFD